MTGAIVNKGDMVTKMVRTKLRGNQGLSVATQEVGVLDFAKSPLYVRPNKQMVEEKKRERERHHRGKEPWLS